MTRIEKLAALGLALVTLAVFGPLCASPFLNYDDPGYVFGNPNVTGGLSAANVGWALTATHRSNWHPLTWLSLQLDHDLYGGLKPGGFHFTNVILHLANVVLLLHVLRRLTGAVWQSTLVAALFALHPLHVESVAWITERKDVLSTLFWMLTLWAYGWYVGQPGPGRYATVALAMALGLMAKPMLVTLPCVLLLLDYWPLGRFAAATPRRVQSLVVEKVPLLVLAGASCVITLIAQERGGALRTLEDFSFASRTANAVVACATYLVQTVWPWGLAPFYPHENLDGSDWRVVSACLLLAGITLASVWQAKRRPYLLVGWLWYLGTLVPVIGLVQVGDQAHADRYTYVPLIGVFVMLAWTVAELAQRGGRIQELAWAGAAVALIGCMILTWVQVGYWRDNVTLWTHAVAVTGPNAPAHFNLATAYRDAGKLEQAAEEFRQVLAVNPRFPHARESLVRTLFSLRRYGEARAEVTPIVQANPDDADAHFLLGLIASLENQAAEAMAQYREVLRLRPTDARVHTNLAVELRKQGDYETALKHLREAERCDPQVRDQPAFQAALKAVLQAQARP